MGFLSIIYFINLILYLFGCLFVVVFFNSQWTRTISPTSPSAVKTTIIMTRTTSLTDQTTTSMTAWPFNTQMQLTCRPSVCRPLRSSPVRPRLTLAPSVTWPMVSLPWWRPSVGWRRKSTTERRWWILPSTWVMPMRRCISAPTAHTRSAIVPTLRLSPIIRPVHSVIRWCSWNDTSPL